MHLFDFLLPWKFVLSQVNLYLPQIPEVSPYCKVEAVIERDVVVNVIMQMPKLISRG